MRLAARICVLFATASAAHAQPAPSLIGGVWVHNESYTDPVRPWLMGQVSMLASFDADGRLTVRRAQVWHGGGSQSEGYFSYQLTGPSTYHSVLNDYEPKQDCSSGLACIAFPAVFGQPGASAECQFTFQTAFSVTISCNGAEPWRWTRQTDR